MSLSTVRFGGVCLVIVGIPYPIQMALSTLVRWPSARDPSRSEIATDEGSTEEELQYNGNAMTE